MSILSVFRKKDETPHCSVVIVAAGSSQRMGTDKIMAMLGGEPVLLHTIRAFQSSELVDEIIVVTRMEKLMDIADLCKENAMEKVKQVIIGGASRMESALAGVSAVSSSAKLVAIHDGARPFVSAELINRTVYAAKEYLAASPALKSTDTLKITDEKGFVVGAVDREFAVRMQTPQVFDSDLVKGALTNAVNKNLSLTDDCSAVALMGVKTCIVDGDEDNIKLTTPRDMLLAEFILENRSRGL